MAKPKYILQFKELNINDVPKVGGKNASLGEMFQKLTKKGVRIPDGFATTADAYWHFIEANELDKKIRNALKGLDVENVKNIAERGRKVRNLIRHAEIPEDLAKEIYAAYKKLCGKKECDVAVRSSATAEDLPEASFAGQQETFLNVRGEEELLDSCRKCFASLFTDRAITYREQHGFNHFDVALSIGVQKMVRSDLASSGVMFSIDTETGFPNAVLINGSWGLGEMVVQGAVNPDEWYVFKPTLKEGYNPILQKKIGEKDVKMVYAAGGTGELTKKVPVDVTHRQKFCLTDKEVVQLAAWAVIIEEHYTKQKGKWTPMDMEWAKDGEDGKLYIVQARPETVQARKERTVLEEYKLEGKGKVLCKGKAVGNKIGAGTANVIKNVKDIEKFKRGQVLVTEMTDPDWVPAMRMASAIVTNRGGRTSHAAIVSRELGLPCIVGTNNATSAIKSGTPVTVSCSEGETGKVYKGKIKFTVQKTDLKKLPETRTEILLNIGNPDQAFELSSLPVKGVGLAREEFIINEYIQIHPMALIKYNQLKDEEAKQKIDELTRGYKDKKDFFVEKLSQGIGTIAAAFWPDDVIVRLSDFKTNEYANLIGGKAFEPEEANPMLGWRGASRYYKEGYRQGFALECKALKRARDEMGLKNIVVMIPMCRTVEEGKKVIKEMQKNGLKRGKNGIKIFCMTELPSNVVLMDEFCKVFDGFSIGSNDLTQMTLGVDRDSELVADIYDERDEAVLRMLEYAVRKAREHKKKIGICGDAPSTYPSIARFLVDCGINSMSLSPDAVMKTILEVAEHEKKSK